MFGIGFPELVLILIIGLIVFGPGKLPELGRTIGKGMREFRKASNALQMAMNEPEKPAKRPEGPAAAREESKTPMPGTEEEKERAAKVQATATEEEIPPDAEEEVVELAKASNIPTVPDNANSAGAANTADEPAADVQPMAEPVKVEDPAAMGYEPPTQESVRAQIAQQKKELPDQKA